MKRIKYLIILFITFILITPSVFASTKTYERDPNKNYNVNKNFEITDNNISNVINTKLVDASEHIYDFSDILSKEEEEALYNKVLEFIELTGMDMVIVTDDLLYSFDSQNEDYAADFYDYNDFGMKYKNNSGVIFFRNTYSADPYYCMYSFGDAQLYYDDARVDYILDGIYDLIHNASYFDGITDFIDRCESYYKTGIPSTRKHYYVDDMGYLKRLYVYPWGMAVFISGAVTAIFMGILVSKNKMVKKATTASDYLDESSINIDVRKDTFITSKTTSYTVSSSSGGGGGGHSHSGSSGGGHSGGGRHG